MIQSSYKNMSTVHAMTNQGHDGIALESHTLPLIGITIGFLIALSNKVSNILSPNDYETAVTIELAFSAIVIGFIFFTNHIISRSKRKKRNEEISLIHKKVLQILWAIIGIAFVLSIYMLTNFGPGKLALWHLILVFGLCLYVIGLFNATWYKVNGVLILILSIIALLFIPHDITLRIFTVLLFVAGGVLVQSLEPLASTKLKQYAYSLGWIVSVVVLSIGIRAVYKSLDATSSLPEIQVSEFKYIPKVGNSIVKLPKNTHVKIKTKLTVDVFAQPFTQTFEAKLSKSLDLELAKMIATGTLRIDGGKWMTMKDIPFTSRYERINTLLPIDGPKIKRFHTVKQNSKNLD